MSKLLPIFILLLLNIFNKPNALPITKTSTKLDNLKRSLDESIILPALAEISIAKSKDLLKKKKNFSKIAQTLVLKEQRVIKSPDYQASPLGKLKSN